MHLQSILCVIACCLALWHGAVAQVTINVTNDFHEVTTVYAADSIYTGMSGKITFSNKRTRYSDNLLNRGLHFKNNAFTYLKNDIQAQYISGSPIIGAHGAGTVLKLTGKFNGDVDQAENSLVLKNGGKIIFGDEMVVDLVLSTSYFTRQFWIWGDGTGTIEFEEGFVADYSAFGTVPSGMGSIRLSNTTLITHHNRNHPLGYRPGGVPLENGTGAINSHLVFENEGGSVWKIMTNDQDFRGGIWVNVNMCIETIKNLEISGVNSKWNDYTNFGGMQMEKPNLTVCKTGVGEFKLSGTQSYNEGSWVNVQEGTFNVATNPTSSELGKGGSNKNDLSVSVESGADFKITSDSAKIDSLIMKAPGAVLEVDIHSVFSGNYANANGVLKINIPDGTELTEGNEYSIFDFTTVNGNFTEIQLPTFGGSIEWDTDELLTTGKISVKSGSITTGAAASASLIGQVRIVPNPAKEYIRLAGLSGSDCEVTITRINGTVVKSMLVASDEVIDVAGLAPGVYFIVFKADNHSGVLKLVK